MAQAPTPEEFDRLLAQQQGQAFAPKPAPVPAPAAVAPPSPEEFDRLLSQQNKTQRQGGEAFREQSIAEDVPLLQKARDLLQFQWVADAPTTLGLKKPVGAERQQAVERMERERGMSLWMRRADPTQGPIANALQLAANTTSGLAAVAGAPVNMAIEGATAVARELGEGAAIALRPVWSNPETERHIQYLADKGDLSLTAQGYGTRLLARSQEAVRAVAEGFNPTLTAAVLAPPGQRTDAALDAFFAMPVESILGTVAMGKAAAEAGGKVRPTTVKQGVHNVEVIPSNVRGEPLKLNDAGWKAYDLTPDWMKPYVWDSDPVQKSAVSRTMDEVISQARQSKSPAATALAELGALFPKEVAQSVENLSADFEKIAGRPLTKQEQFRALEGSLHGDETGLRKVVEFTDLTAETRAARGRLGRALADSGLDDDRTRMILAYTQRASVLKKEAPEAARAFAEKAGDPRDIMGALADKLEKADPIDRVAMAQGLAAKADVLANDPHWVALMEMPEQVGKFGWKPLEQTEAVVKFREAVASITEQARRRSEELRSEAERKRAMGYEEEARKLEKAADAIPNRRFDVQDYEHGALTQSTAFRAWQKLVGVEGSTRQGRARVAAMLTADPLTRFTATPEAPPHAKWLAARLSDPNQPYSRFRQEISRASRELGENMAVSPVVLAKRLDEYLSHSLSDAMVANESLIEDMAPSRMAQILTFQGARHKRKIADLEASRRYGEAMLQGKLDLSQVAQDTLNRVGLTAQMANFWHEVYDSGTKAGVVSDVEVPGWKQVATAKATEHGKNASGDPYNFMFGKMAGKWVAPEVAQRLQLAREAFAEVSPLMQLFKVMKTIYQPVGYQMRNHVTDMTRIAISSNVPMKDLLSLSEQNKASTLRYFADLDAGRRPRADPVMQEAIANGVYQPERMIAMLDSAVPDPGKRKASRAAMELASRVMTAPIPEAMPALAQVMQHLSTIGALLSPAFYKTRAKGFAESVKAVNAAMRDVRMEEQFRKLSVPVNSPIDKAAAALERTWLLGYEALRKTNEELAQTWLAHWTAHEEADRRLLAYRVAREHLKMDEARALEYVRSTVYGAHDRPEWQQQLNASAVPTPPFYEYGAWSTSQNMRRAMNDKHLFGYMLLAKGLHAYNEEAEAENEKDTREFRTRLGFALASNAGANHAILGSSADLRMAYEAMGLTRLAKAMQGSDIAYTLPKQDLASLAGMWKDIDVTRPGPEVAARLHPVADAALMLLDPDSYRMSRRAGADPLNVTGPEHSRAFQTVVNALGIFGNLDALEKVYSGIKGGVAVATGEPQRRGKINERLDPTAAIMSTLSPVVRINTIDKAAMPVRLKQMEKGAINAVNERVNKFKASLDPQDAEGAADLDREKIAAKYQAKLIRLRFAALAGWDGIDQKIHRLTNAREAALQRFNAGKDVPRSMLDIPDIDATIEAFDRATDAVVQGVLDGYAGANAGTPKPD